MQRINSPLLSSSTEHSFLCPHATTPCICARLCAHPSSVVSVGQLGSLPAFQTFPMLLDSLFVLCNVKQHRANLAECT